MKNKKILLLFSPLLFLFLNICILSAPVDPSQMPSLEDLDAFVKELTLETFKTTKGRPPHDDKELQEFEADLQKMGEQMLEEIIEEGKKTGKSESEALDSFFYDLLGSMGNTEAPSPDQESEKSPQESPKKIVQKQEVLNLKDLIDNLIDTIHNFRLKVASNKQMRDNLLPYKYRLEDLIYLLHVINNEKLITTYLADPTVAPLIEKLKSFYGKFRELEEQFDPSSGSMDEKTPYEILDILVSSDADEIIAAYQQQMRTFNSDRKKKEWQAQGYSEEQIAEKLHDMNLAREETIAAYTQLRNQEEAKYLFEALVKTLDQAIEVDKILEGIKAILEKYKKDAAVEIKEREKVEKEARDAQEKALRTRPLLYPLPEKKFTWPPATSSSPSSYSSSNYTPDYSNYGASTPSTSSSADKGSGSPSSPKGGGRKSSGKKDDKDKNKEKEEKDKKEPKKDAKPSDTKKGDDQQNKKPKIDQDVADKMAVVKEFIKEFDKKLTDNFNELKGTVGFLTQPFASVDMPEFNAQLEKAKKIRTIMVDLTTAMNTVTKRIKMYRDELKKKPEKLNSFNESVKAEITKIKAKIEGTCSYTPEELEKLKEKGITNPKKDSDKLVCLLETISSKDPKGIPVLEGGDMPTTKPSDPAKKFYFFGIEDPLVPIDQDLRKILAADAIDADGNPTNLVDLLQKSYKEALDLISDKSNQQKTKSFPNMPE